jgi:hypothetical protein
MRGANGVTLLGGKNGRKINILNERKLFYGLKTLRDWA